MLDTSRDALFEMGEALATDPGAGRFGALLPAPRVQRRWPSLYEAQGDADCSQAHGSCAGRVGQARRSQPAMVFDLDQQHSHPT